MSTFMQMKRDFDGMGFHFNGHVELFDVSGLNLTSAERAMIDDCFSSDSTANHWLHALAFLWDRFQAQTEAREHHAVSGTPILPVDGS